jgi:(1->4)-alpha-D-glucan 1-alpha-D-glucosylmutase
VCLNEVGCNASQFGASIDAFHAHNANILSRWPLSMTTTTTHDTKRSEDVRSRLAVLSEMPGEWSEAVAQLDTAARKASDGAARVSNSDAYVFYQTVVGALPFERPTGDAQTAFADRIAGYMRKATREAKLATSWATPNVAYEQGLDDFVRAALRAPAFVDLAARFITRIAPYGAGNSLSQLALRLAAPGVPDIYQGCDLWGLTLVDPDNRAPVDFEARQAILAALESQGEPTADGTRRLLETYTDGRIKMYLTWRALTLRRTHPALFLEGSYEPIHVSDHVIAFERCHDEQRLLCVVPRLMRTLTGGRQPWALGRVWKDATLRLSRAGTFRDVFTGSSLAGEALPLAEVLSAFPVAWLLGS